MLVLILLLDRQPNIIWRWFGINFVVLDLLNITINWIWFTIVHPWVVCGASVRDYSLEIVVISRSVDLPKSRHRSNLLACPTRLKYTRLSTHLKLIRLIRQYLQVAHYIFSLSPFLLVIVNFFDLHHLRRWRWLLDQNLGAICHDNCCTLIGPTTEIDHGIRLFRLILVTSLRRDFHFYCLLSGSKIAERGCLQVCMLLLLLPVLSTDCWSLMDHFRLFFSWGVLDHMSKGEVTGTFVVRLLATISVQASTLRIPQHERSVINATQDITGGYDLALLLSNWSLSQIVPIILRNLSSGSLAFSHLTSKRGDEHEAGRSHICDSNMVALVLLLIFTNHCHCGLHGICFLDLYLRLLLDFLFFMYDVVLDCERIIRTSEINSFLLLCKKLVGIKGLAHHSSIILISESTASDQIVFIGLRRYVLRRRIQSECEVCDGISNVVARWYDLPGRT